ncbi:MAG: uracil-DNA glycosylase [Bacillota bacterium]
MSKSEQLKNLYELYMKEFEGKEVVLGDGNVDSRLLLIGEAPGKDEVQKSKPFVGAAGKNLTEFLGILNLNRENIYITNAIKYRLSKINPDTGRISNRPATKKEIEENRDYLLKEISIIDPQYIVTLGNVPLKAVWRGSDVTIGEVHGKLSKVFVGEAKYELFPLYHPASVIYNAGLKEVYYKDLENLKQVLKSKH